MRAEEQHGAVLVKDVLRAVSVVNIPVNNGDPLRPMFALRVPGRYRDVVKEAEAHTSRGVSVMAGRTHGTEGVCGFPGEYGIHGGEHAAGRQASDFVRARPDVGVPGAELGVACCYFARYQIDVASGMRERKFIIRGAANFDGQQTLEKAGGLEPVHHRAVTGWLLRVAGARVVSFDPRISGNRGNWHMPRSRL